MLRQQELAKLDTKSPKQLLLNRQALHSSVLTFTHPTTGERVTTHASAPRDMATVVGLLRQYKLEQTLTPGQGHGAVDMSRILPLDSSVVRAVGVLRVAKRRGG